MEEKIKMFMKQSGLNVAGWIVTGFVVTVSAVYLYRQYIEFKKLRIDYKVSQYWLRKMEMDYPDFEPKKS